jgi:biopolymer transport protein ExbD
MVESLYGRDSRGVSVPAREVASIWRRAVTENPKLIAAVKTGPDVAYQRTVDVLDQLRVAGAQRVSLQLLERR